MRLVTCHYRKRPYLGVMLSEVVFVPAWHGEWPASIDGMLALIDAGSEAWARLEELAAGPPSAACLPKHALEFEAPIPKPRQNVMCLGWNYADHAQETAVASERELKLPEHPIVFTKAANSVNGPYADVPMDATVSTMMDWEVELAVVIGKGGRRIAAARALEHVFGYTVINDISARDIQRRHKQFFLGKSLTGSCPMGPGIVTADAIPDPQRLDLASWVNGDPKQASNTGLQIFDVATMISILSQGMALEPGDIVATGTPSGVGFARNPPQFLKPGDIVTCEVQGIGRLRNRMVG